VKTFVSIGDSFVRGLPLNHEKSANANGSGFFSGSAAGAGCWLAEGAAGGCESTCSCASLVCVVTIVRTAVRTISDRFDVVCIQSR